MHYAAVGVYGMGTGLRITLIRVVLIKKPSLTHLVLDTQLVEQFVEGAPAHAIILGNLCDWNGVLVLQDTVVVTDVFRFGLQLPVQ
jgi:hypothetical protein